MIGKPFVDPDGDNPVYTTPACRVTVYPNGTLGGKSWYNGGSYTQTTGLDLSASFSAGWDGLSAGVSVPLSFTDSETTTSSKELKCSFEDPSSTEPCFFCFYTDDSLASYQEGINVHIWYGRLA